MPINLPNDTYTKTHCQPASLHTWLIHQSTTPSPRRLSSHPSKPFSNIRQQSWEPRAGPQFLISPVSFLVAGHCLTLAMLRMTGLEQRISGEQGEQIGLACLIAPAFLNYLSGHRSKERKREENEKEEAMCPRKSSRNWAVSPDRQPLIFTIHKHRKLCSARQISQCRQHLSVCGLKDCSSPPQEVQILMAIYKGEVY